MNDTMIVIRDMVFTFICYFSFLRFEFCELKKICIFDAHLYFDNFLSFSVLFCGRELPIARIIDHLQISRDDASTT